jgi:hypothetical protein
MPIHIDEMHSDVTVIDGDLPLNEAQVEKLVQIIMRRLAQRQREQRMDREATTLRPHAGPPLRDHVGEDRWA